MRCTGATYVKALIGSSTLPEGTLDSLADLWGALAKEEAVALFGERFQAGGEIRTDVVPLSKVLCTKDSKRPLPSIVAEHEIRGAK